MIKFTCKIPQRETQFYFHFIGSESNGCYVTTRNQIFQITCSTKASETFTSSTIDDFHVISSTVSAFLNFKKLKIKRDFVILVGNRKNMKLLTSKLNVGRNIQ